MAASSLASFTFCFIILGMYFAVWSSELVNSCSNRKVFRSSLTWLKTLCFWCCFLCLCVFLSKAITSLSSICVWSLYTSHILLSFPSMTCFVFRTLPFNLFYVINWVPSLTSEWLTRKPRSSGLCDLGGVYLRAPSRWYHRNQTAEVVFVLRTFQALLLSVCTTENSSSRPCPQHFTLCLIAHLWAAVSQDALPQVRLVKPSTALQRDVPPSPASSHTLLQLVFPQLCQEPHQQSGWISVKPDHERNRWTLSPGHPVGSARRRTTPPALSTRGKGRLQGCWLSFLAQS